MESLGKAHDRNKKVKFEVLFATTYYEVDQMDVYIKPQIRRIVLSQYSFPQIVHTEEGDYYRIAQKYFMNGLTENNKHIIENIQFVDCKDSKFVDYSTPIAEICYDPENFVYVRFLEGDMEDVDFGDSEITEEESTEG